MESVAVYMSAALPQEIWIKIFKNLSWRVLIIASTVCKEFYGYAMDPMLWKNLELELGLGPDQLNIQQALLRRCTRLLNLKLVGSSQWSKYGEGVEKKAMYDLLSILVARCTRLKTLQSTNCPYLRQFHISQLINSSISQITHINLNQHGKTDAFSRNQVEFHQVGTTDHYRKGKPYKILHNPGSSAIVFNFNVTVERLSSVSLSLNHCRTMADGVVCITVNGRPAEQRSETGQFVKKVILAPIYNFGWESFSVCPSLVHDGNNKIALCLDSTSPGVYWLSDVRIDTVNK